MEQVYQKYMDNTVQCWVVGYWVVVAQPKGATKTVQSTSPNYLAVYVLCMTKFNEAFQNLKLGNALFLFAEKVECD